MNERTRDREDASNDIAGAAFRVRLPGFVAQEPVGLGDVLGRAGYALGMTPCAACNERRARLNRWIVFTR